VKEKELDIREAEAFEKASDFPFTYAADCICLLAGYEKTSLGTKLKLSRGDASRILKGFSQAFGADRGALISALAEYYRKNEEEIAKNSRDQYLKQQEELLSD